MPNDNPSGGRRTIGRLAAFVTLGGRLPLQDCYLQD